MHQFIKLQDESQSRINLKEIMYYYGNGYDLYVTFKTNTDNGPDEYSYNSESLMEEDLKRLDQQLGLRL